jgi:hypothetical protein
MAHTTTTTIASSPQRHGSSTIAVILPGSPPFQVSLFLIFFNTVLMAHGWRQPHCGMGPPPPPPQRSLFPWWRRDHVCSPPLGSNSGGVDVLCPPHTSTGSAGIAARAAPCPPPPPRARRSPGAAITFDYRRHWVDGSRVTFGRRRCQGGVAVAALMARASTDGLGNAARAAPRPPPRARCSPGAAITFGCRCC